MNWLILDSPEQMNAIHERSFRYPVIVFKHSPRCGISSFVQKDFEKKLSDALDTHIHAYHLDVIAHRDISDGVSERYKVRHESPQVLVIVSGLVKYDASHQNISADRVLSVTGWHNPKKSNLTRQGE